MNYFKEIFDWSEVWALLVPLIIFIIKKPAQQYLKPVLFYVCISLCLSIAADVIWKYKHYSSVEFKKVMPEFLWSNNFLYNIISIVRLLFFLWFFQRLNFKLFKLNNLFIALILFLIIIINFFFESFNEFSSFTFSLESIVLLTYSIAYFLYLIKNDQLRTEFDASLFVVTGIAIYEAANFFIFLFHKALTLENSQLAVAIWKLANVYFIIFCLYLAKAFYGSNKKLFAINTKNVNTHTNSLW